MVAAVRHAHHHLPRAANTEIDLTESYG
jgi:hypothetical protein